LAKAEARRDELDAELDKGDSWAWIRRKFEKAGRNYRWFKPREWADGRNSLVGTRYEVMGWLHCIFGEADVARTYLEICLEQQERADDAEAERDRQYEANAGLIAKVAKLETALQRALVFAKEEQDRREKDALPEPTPQEEELLTEIANVVDGIMKALGD
jgi:hypothetical protein